MSNFSIEITAPAIVAVIEKLISALAPKTVTINQTLPQTPAEQAVRQHIAPVPQQAPTYPQPVAPVTQQSQYAAPPQPYQPAAPVNPIPTAPIQTNRTTGAVNMVPVAAPALVPPAPIALSINQAPVAAAPAYQIDDLARAAAQLMDAGKQQECLALLAQFQVRGLNDLKPEQFGAFATALRQMGVKL